MSAKGNASKNIPEKEKLTILILKDGLYEENVYRHDEPISSALFPQIQLTANEIFISA